MKRLLLAVLTLGLALGIFASCDLEPDPVIDINGTWKLSTVGGASVSMFPAASGEFSGTIVVSDGNRFTSQLTIAGVSEGEKEGSVEKISDLEYDFVYEDATTGTVRYTMSDDGTEISCVNTLFFDPPES